MSSKKLLFVLSLILFTIFVYYSFLVSKELFTQSDFDTTVRLQDHISRKFDGPFSFFSILGSAEITGLIWLFLLVLVLIRKYWLTFLAMFVFPLSHSFELFGKLFLLHPGPPHLFHRGVISFNLPSGFVQTDFSYPSGHLMRTSFLIFFLLLFLQYKIPTKLRLPLQAALLILLLLMAVSRIYLGEHWTTDVVGGTLLGASLGLFVAITIPLRKTKSLTEI